MNAIFLIFFIENRSVSCMHVPTYREPRTFHRRRRHAQSDLDPQDDVDKKPMSQQPNP